MSKSKILSISLPEEVYDEYTKIASQLRLTKSELFRRYLAQPKHASSDYTDATDPSDALRRYWGLAAKQQKPITVVLLAVIVRSGKVLIVSRHSDSIITNLSWAFPGGTARSLNFADSLTKSLHERLGVNAAVSGLIGARLIPESAAASEAVVALYFSVDIDTDALRLLPSAYQDAQWVAVADIYRYFTTSTSDEVTRYLQSRR